MIQLKITALISVLLATFTGPTNRAVAIPAEGHKIMIAGPSPYGVQAGKEIALKGGNVVDVAVAVSLTLAVSSPYFASLGGGGFALLKMGDKDVEVLDFRETAPAAMGPDYYLKKPKNASTRGGTAVGVPGHLAGLWAMHKKYGSMNWKDLCESAIKLAKNGMPVRGEWAKITGKASEYFNDHGLKHFLKNGETKYKPGETLKQPGLARALEIISRLGPGPFYRGRIGTDIVDAVKKTGGHMTKDDLAGYKVRWMKPMHTEFMGHKIHLMPPPSSGGFVIKSELYLVDRLGLSKQKPFSVAESHLLGEIMARSFRGRALLGDPDFHQNPIASLTSQSHLDKMAKSISHKKVVKLKPLKEEDFKNSAKESTETTHFSVLDAKGNAVSLTVTLNGRYGSGVVSEKYGIALNNEMDDFTTRPGEPNMFGLVQGKGNLVQPGKRPLSSMSPTLVEKNGKIVMALGAPGGPRIINGVFMALYRTLVNGFDLDTAIQSPRVHHQFLPHKLFVDRNKWSPDVLDLLRKKGHEVEESWMGRVYAVRKRDKDGILEAAFDARGDGAADGI